MKLLCGCNNVLFSGLIMWSNCLLFLRQYHITFSLLLFIADTDVFILIALELSCTQLFLLVSRVMAPL